MKHFLVFLGLFLCTNSFSLELQILHTNDLHGFAEHTVTNSKIGGYSKLKTLIDQNRAKNHNTLLVDAGDFLEGNIFYLANAGKFLMNIMGELGMDAVTLGNHDWQMGTEGLEKLLKSTNPKFPLLGANFKTKPNFRNIRSHVLPFKDFYMEGVKVTIAGLTTNEKLYAWRHTGGTITDPIEEGRELFKWLKERKEPSDFLIALTHLGSKVDIALARETKYLDLVIGGHSHETLTKPIMVKNKRGMFVPIVQSGSHGRYLGRLILDLQKGKNLNIKSYQLLDNNGAVPKDTKIEFLVQEGRSSLGELYGESWLKETIVKSSVPLSFSEEHFSLWDSIFSQAMKKASGADIFLHSPSFKGAKLPAGKLSREKIINSYPRIFEFNQTKGWQLFESQINGALLESFIQNTLNGGLPLSVVGMTFDIFDSKNRPISMKEAIRVLNQKSGPLKNFLGIKDKVYIRNIRIGGEEINRFRNYKVVLPEGIARGALAISCWSKVLLRNLKVMPLSMWEVLFKELQEIKSIDEDFIRGHGFGLKENNKVQEENYYNPFLWANRAVGKITRWTIGKALEMASRTLSKSKTRTSEIEREEIKVKPSPGKYLVPMPLKTSITSVLDTLNPSCGK